MFAAALDDRSGGVKGARTFLPLDGDEAPPVRDKSLIFVLAIFSLFSIVGYCYDPSGGLTIAAQESLIELSAYCLLIERHKDKIFGGHSKHNFVSLKDICLRKRGVTMAGSGGWGGDGIHECDWRL